MTDYRFEQTINVTKPTLPSLAEYQELLEHIWETAWLTNNGELVRDLEGKLVEHLGVDYLATTCNGTLALLLALRAVGLRGGSVITTPFTFPATVSVLDWLGFRIIFADVDPLTGNIDPVSVAGRVESDTVAVLAVHVYGNPCDHDALQRVCADRELKLLYDAAHAFGVRCHGESVLRWGDASTLSFHATKLFSTVEGGAVVASSSTVQKEVQLLRNFGILDEETVVAPGINAKMNELQAAYGLLRLKDVDDEIRRRADVARTYDTAFSDVDGICPITPRPDVEPNHSYYPIRVVEDEFGCSRDELKIELDRHNVKARKYFYPLCSRIEPFQEIETAACTALPAACRLENEVLCLPIYGDLPVSAAARIAEIVSATARAS